MAPQDDRLLFFDFGNLREFYDGGTINLKIAPTVTVSGGNATFNQIQALPNNPNVGTPLGGLLLTITTVPPNSPPWVGAYYVQFWCNAGSVTGDFVVSCTITLVDGTVLTRQGSLVVG